MAAADAGRGRSLAGIATDAGGRLLVAKRKPGGSLGGRWEFPGGKAEDGESDREALAREFAEELGVAAEVGELLAEAEFRGGEKTFSLAAYRVTLGSQDLTLSEHTEWRWTTLAEIADEAALDGGFVDSDLLLLPALKERLAHD